MRRLSASAFLALLAALGCAGIETAARAQKPAGPALRLGRGDAFEVTGLAPAALDALAKKEWTPEQWSALFAVYVSSEKAFPADQPAMLGAYRVDAGVLRFQPRFPLRPGLGYRAVFRPAALPGHDAALPPVAAEFWLPKADAVAATAVQHVYPSRNRLPENLLKFYIHFSAPMSRGEAYRHIHLLDASGQEVEAPFLELGEELWDPGMKRFTLLFDPGRIKRGLKPREEVGPALEQGKAYTLVIDRAWSDAAGNPLKADYTKAFRVGPPDDEQPDPKTWKIEPPRAGTPQALAVIFPEPMDQALLEGLLGVTDEQGQRLAGKVQTADEETRWRFLPERPWQAGSYRLVVDAALEDLAANSIERPFEVDVFRKVEQRVRTRTVALPFRVEP